MLSKLYRTTEKESQTVHPTKETYTQLDQAYVYFNTHLFAGSLPPCVMTLHRKKSAYGYFWGETWSDREGKNLTDEIALNPEAFKDRSLEEILSTLVHEMCHLQQHHFGKPSSNGYHNKEWAQMMRDVGLIPSETGQAGGKQTGQKMTHYIEKTGRFQTACQTLVDKGFIIPWQAITTENDDRAKKKTASKTKYSCVPCSVNAWAKPDTALICGGCGEVLEAQD